MRKIMVLISTMYLIVTSVGCVEKYPEKDKEYTLPEVQLPDNYDMISNNIPEWVADSESKTKLFAYSWTDSERYDNYVKEQFPHISDSEWTQEQSDQMRIGYGIYLFSIDANKTSNIVYYPILYNDIIELCCPL